MNVFEILDERLNKHFNGVTGKELIEFLKNECQELERYYEDMDENEDDGYDSQAFYISMPKNCAMLLEEFEYEEIIFLGDKVCYNVSDAIKYDEDDNVMIKGYLYDNPKYNIWYLINRMHELCEENNASGYITLDDQVGDSDLVVSFNNDEIDYEVNRTLFIDDNADKLLKSFLFIARRAYNEPISDYLELCPVLYKRAKDYHDDLDIRIDALTKKADKAEIIAQIKRTPKSFELYKDDLSVINDVDILKAFIDTCLPILEDGITDIRIRSYEENKELMEYIPEAMHKWSYSAGVLSEGIFSLSFIYKHGLLDYLVDKLTIKLIKLENEADEALAISILKDYPALIVLFSKYYRNKKYDNKEFEKLITRFKLATDQYYHSEIANRLTIELANKYNPKAIDYLLDDRFERNFISYAEYFDRDYLKGLIKDNYRLMSSFKNEFSYDDELVKEIKDNCPSAALLLSDEAIIRYNLKSVAELACSSCNRCSKRAHLALEDIKKDKA